MILVRQSGTTYTVNVGKLVHTAKAVTVIKLAQLKVSKRYLKFKLSKSANWHSTISNDREHINPLYYYYDC